MKKFILFACLLSYGTARAGNEEDKVPPVLPPAAPAQSKVDDVGPTPLPAPAPKKEECAPTEQKETIPGRCICDKPKPEIKILKQVVEKVVTKYKTKVVEKPVVKYKTKVVEVYVDRPVEKTVEKNVYVDRPVDRVVEKTVTAPGEVKRHNLSLFYGRGPNGVDRVLHVRKDGTKEYEFYNATGDVGALQYTYRFTETWNASALGVTNETYMGGVGLSF